MSDPASEVRAGCDRWARMYDHHANPLPALDGRVVDAFLDNGAGLAALAADGGTGRHALRLAAAGAKVTALDFSAGMGAMAMAAARAGFALDGIDEIAPDDEFAVEYPRAAKHVVWPMLVVLRHAAGAAPPA